MNSKGVHLSGGMGREAATLVDTGAAALDVAGYDPARFEPEIMRDDQWRKQGAQEAEVVTTPQDTIIKVFNKDLICSYYVRKYTIQL